MPRPVAAIDVGSNSVRVAIMSLGEHGYLEVLEEARAVPRLIRDVEDYGEFRPETVEHLIEVLADFRRLARTLGADIVAAATSAARDAANGADVVRRVTEELDIPLRVIDGEEEAYLAFLGATYTLPVERGFVVDIGGGSMEIVQFEDRRVVRSWTLPLGAVRLTDRFLKSDPLVTSELRALRQHIAKHIDQAGLPELGEGAVLVGTGGTIRNLGKIHRARQTYPLSLLHGYEVSRDEMRRVTDLVQQRSLAERRSIAGLNEDRADTIVAGALVVDALMAELRAASLLVSGQGLREGMALEATPRDLPSLSELREGALRGAVERFVPTRADLADERLALIRSLTAAVGFDAAPESTEVLEAAAFVQDLGRSVDYYNRERHTEFLLLEHGLAGWSHREVALICAIVRQAHQEKYAPAAYRPLINGRDTEWIGAAATLLALAEAIVNRRGAVHGTALGWRREDEALVITDECLSEWTPEQLIARVRRSFGLALRFAARAGAEAR